MRMRLSNDQEAARRTQPSGLFARTLLPRQTQPKIPTLSQTPVCFVIHIGFEYSEKNKYHQIHRFSTRGKRKTKLAIPMKTSQRSNGLTEHAKATTS